MPRATPIASVLLALLALGCEEPPASADASLLDAVTATDSASATDSAAATDSASATDTGAVAATDTAPVADAASESVPDAFTPPDAFTAPDARTPPDAFTPPDASTRPDAFTPDAGTPPRADLHVHIEVSNTCVMTVTPREVSVPPDQTLYLDWHNHSRDYPVDVWMSYGGGYTDLAPGATWDEPIGHCSTPFVGDEYADITTACSSFRFLIHCR